MKRLFFVFIILISLIFSSCSKEKYQILPYENKDSVIECTVNDKFDAVIKRQNGDLSLSVLAPEEIRGISFVFSNSGDKMISGDVSIPVSRNELRGIYAIASIAELTEDTITSAVSRDSIGEISIEANGLLYTLFFSTDGALTDIKITGDELDYSVRIKSITVL